MLLTPAKRKGYYTRHMAAFTQAIYFFCEKRRETMLFLITIQEDTQNELRQEEPT